MEHKSVTYKGYEVRAVITAVSGGKWEAETELSIEKGPDRLERRFVLIGDFSTETEAVQASLKCGMDIIDGKIPGSEPPVL